MQINQEVIDIIKKGGVGVLPTDTIYGIVCSVFDKQAFERVYEAKKRPKDKRLIVLIGNRGQLPSLGINPNAKQLESLNEFWPGPISIEMKCDDTVPYIHAGNYCFSTRLPAETWLRRLVNETGPLVATSANLSGEPTPGNIEDIKLQIPDLDFYVEGKVNTEPSRLGSLDENGNMFWIRGA